MRGTTISGLTDMKFVRAIWKLLVGIKDALVLIFMLLFFGVLYGGALGPPGAGQGRRARARPQRRAGRAAGEASQFSELAGGNRQRANIALRDLVAALDAAPRTTTGSRRSRSTSTASPAAARRRSATLPTRSAGCARRASRSSLMRSAIPTTATSSPRRRRKSGSTRWARCAIAGPGGSNLYYKGLLDKLGVTANVYRVGTYKSAVEPFIRNDMSPEARENYQALGQADARNLARGRRTSARPKANSTCSSRTCPARSPRPAATWPRRRSSAGLVDQHRRPPRLRGAAGRSSAARTTDDGRLQADQARRPTSPTRSTRTRAGRSASSPSPAMIVDGKAAAGTAGGDTIAQAIEDGIRDKTI